MLRLRTLLYAAMVLCALVAESALAQVPSVLRYEVQGTTNTVRTFTEPAASFVVNAATPAEIQITVADAAGFAQLHLRAPAGQALAPGAMENARSPLSDGPLPGIDFLPVAGCSASYARFAILEIAFDAASMLGSLAVDFEVRCADRTTFGELRLRSAMPLTVDKPPGATAPDPFGFVPAKDALPGALIVSNTTTIFGINAPADISIVGGEYSVNDGPFIATQGVVNNFDHVALRRTAAADLSTTVTTTLTVGGVASAFEITTFTPGVPFTAFAFRSAASPDGIVPAQQVELRPPEWTVDASLLDFRTLQVTAASLPRAFSVVLGSFGSGVAPGVYEEAGGQIPPILSVAGTGCTQVAGRYIIHEISFGARGVPDRLAMSFEQWCSERPPVFGEVRINSSIPLPSMVLDPDTSPYPFVFRAQSPVAAGALVRSNRTAIDGVNRPVSVAITGGEYSLNGGAFTSAPGFANPGDDVVVQLIASRFAGGTRSVTFTAGGFPATMNVQTYAPAMSLTGLYFQRTDGAVPAEERTRLLMPPVRQFLLLPGSGLDAHAFDPGTGHWILHVAGPLGPHLDPGNYGVTMRPPFQAPGQPAMYFEGPGLLCDNVFGRFDNVFSRFDVREAAYDNLGNPLRVAIDFEQHCNDPAAPPTFGEMRYNSSVPFSALLAGAPCTAADPACVADVAIGQSIASPVDIGSTTTITLTATNAGPAIAHNVVVSDSLPPSLTVASAAAGCTATSTTVSCLADMLAPGSVVSFPVVVRAVMDGSFSNTATVAAEELDAAPVNNTASLAGAVRTDANVVNISTRGSVGTGDDVVIGGFIIGGSTPKTVVVTAIGPALAAAGVPAALANPTLTLVRSLDGAIVATNDDWQAAPNADAIRAAGLAPSHPNESAIMMMLPPGAYTAIVAGAGGGTGVGMVAVYEVDHPESPLVNISTRGRVLTGADVMIGGFIIQGSQPRTVVITGIGPSLAAAGVPSPLPNPVLMLVRSSDGAVVATNDDWGTAANAAQLQAVGFAPANARESAIMMTLEPGAYTAILSGAGGGTGVGIVAVYTLP